MSADRPKPGLLERAERLGRSLETTFLVVLLTAMLLLGGSQIFLRNIVGGGLAWGDEALRIMVLWLALIGAVAASREDRHVSIDLASRILSSRWQRPVAALVHAVTALVCLVLAWYALNFVAESREFEDVLLGDLPAWWFQSVLPIAFFLIGYRYVIWCLRALRRILARDASE